MGQGGQEVRLGSDVDFQSGSADNKNILGDPSSIAGRRASAISRSLHNIFTDTADQVRVDSLVNDDTGGGSHCWEKDGEFHIVCIFVVAAGIVCSLLTLVCAYKIYQLVAETPVTGRSTLSQGSIKQRRESENILLSTMANSDRIDTVEKDTMCTHNKVDNNINNVVVMHNKKDNDVRIGQSKLLTSV